MALREIRTYGDSILSKECRVIKDVTPRIRELVQDMLDTMYYANGVGLAAPQVGVLKRVVVIDVEGNAQDSHALIMVNPEILETEGEQTGDEGCLSVPGKVGTVTRPSKVKARAFDLDMNEYEIEAEGILARAICHEVDHLNGKVYVELAEGGIRDVESGNDGG